MLGQLTEANVYTCKGHIEHNTPGSNFCKGALLCLICLASFARSRLQDDMVVLLKLDLYDLLFQTWQSTPRSVQRWPELPGSELRMQRHGH